MALKMIILEFGQGFLKFTHYYYYHLAFDHLVKSIFLVKIKNPSFKSLFDTC